LSINKINLAVGSLRSSISTKKIDLPSILNYQKAIARVFLNGFAVNDGCKGYQIQIDAQDIKQNSFTVSVATGSQTDLKKVYFSYIIFNPSEVPFASYGGSVSKSAFTGISYQDISNSIYYNNLILQGLVKVNAPLQINLAVSFDDDFILGFSNQGASLDFVYSYVVVGVPGTQICGTCRSQKYVHKETCLSACPDSTYAFNYKDGSIGCRACSAKLNLLYSRESRSCVCANGYQQSNGLCVELGGIDKAIKNTGAIITIINNQKENTGK